jgi:hypothetical protein
MVIKAASDVPAVVARAIRVTKIERRQCTGLFDLG